MIPPILAIFTVWRIGLFLIAWIGSHFLTFAPRFPYADIYLQPSGLPNWLWSFANFDGVHYLTIAKEGYAAQYTQAFFPLYPLLIQIIHKLAPFVPELILGLLISNLFLLFSLMVFWKLLLLDYHGKSLIWIILFMLLIPTSFFFGSYYSESPFLFMVFLSFLFARRKKWWLAGICGGLASSTRLVGIFLLPALLWEWNSNRKKDKLNRPNNSSKLTESIIYYLKCPSLYLIPLGLLFYMIYLRIRFGDFLYFWHVQPVFGAARSGTSLVLLPQVFWRYVKILHTVRYTSEAFWVSVIELVSVLFSSGALFLGHLKKVRTSYLIFAWLTVLIPTLSGTFSSMPRYILTAFPIFISLALIKNDWLKIVILGIFSCLLALLTVLFTRGHWVA